MLVDLSRSMRNYSLIYAIVAFIIVKFPLFVNGKMKILWLFHNLKQLDFLLLIKYNLFVIIIVYAIAKLRNDTVVIVHIVYSNTDTLSLRACRSGTKLENTSQVMPA